MPATRWFIKVERHMANEKQTGGAERGGSGNFANDPQRASEAGKKGGEHSHGGGSQQQSGSQSEPGGSRSGSGNFANDRDKASEAGKKGGEKSQGGR
jgi:general stress protein YciG